MRRYFLGLLFVLIGGCAASHSSPIASPRQVIASKTDLWGEAALRQPDGPTYEFFEELLPPIRYVDADFRHYPINLSAPGAMNKARLVSNGSAINARAHQPNWNNESGTPVRILVGSRRESFGEDLARLDGPHYADGYLPIVQLRYECAGESYSEEALACVDPELAARGAVLIKFDLPAANCGRVELRFEGGYDLMKVDGQHVVRDASGTPLAQLDDHWEFQPARSAFFNKLEHPRSLVALIFTNAAPTSPATRAAGAGMAAEMEAAGRAWASTQPSPVNLDFYQRQRELCVNRWNEIVSRGMQVQVPEKVVMDAWRTLIVAQHAILRSQQMNYSASNQYQRQYANESGDSIRSLALWGHRDAARNAFRPLFEYVRPAAVMHDAAFKLQDLCDYYFLTRDKQLIDQLRPLWQKEVDLLIRSRQSNGLLPKERYCSDIQTPVNSLNNNANAWRGLRDMSIVLGDCGDAAEADRLAKIAAEYKPIVLAAMNKAIFRNVDPPFVPVAMDGEEQPPNPITSTRLGSYWNLVVPCILWSGIFPIDSEPADAIIHYIQRNGGLCMGLTRVQSVRGVWTNAQNIDDLYVIRYSNALLKRDEPDRALVTFYGKLAHGFTRETFIDGESTGIEPLDRFGRQVALPPNSTANASFLIQLRNLLVQDWDMDDAGRADTLRLAYATPRAWLEDGKTICVERAPTQFGNVSFTLTSHLSRNRIDADIILPDQKPPDVRLRLRVPRGYQVARAEVNGSSVAVDHDTLNLSSATAKSLHIIATVRRANHR